MNKINWNFDNTYFGLSDAFRENINPIPVNKPKLILINKNLAKEFFQVILYRKEAIL